MEPYEDERLATSARYIASSRELELTLDDGWTSEQGREYLERTYGKRSRHQLTDEELMSFLLYLEDQ